MLTQVSQLTTQVANLSAFSSPTLSTPQLTNPPPTLSTPQLPNPPPVSSDMAAAPFHREPPVTSPEPFSGELSKCHGFLLQCGLGFQQRPLSFATESSKVHYALGLLRGRALVWAEAVCSNQQLTGLTFADFSIKLRTVFDHPDHAGNVSKRLLNLRQGTDSVAEYSGLWRQIPNGTRKHYKEHF